MVCSGLKPGAAGLKAQMNPLSYGGTPDLVVVASTTVVLSCSLITTINYQI